MAYDDIEQSVQDAGPAELYDFTLDSGEVYRYTSYGADVVFNGNLYTNVPDSRSDIEVPDLSSDQSDIIVELPLDNPVVVAYAPGIPIESLRVTVTRYHPAWGVSLQHWDGYASDMKYKGTTAAFRVPSGAADALSLEVPSARLQRLCNNLLYDSMCTIDPTTRRVITTVSSISVDGLTYAVASVGAVGSLKHGYIQDPISGAKRTITDVSGLNVTLQCQFPTGKIVTGQTVHLFAGCDHQLSTCKNVFNNVVNFTGHPYMPSSNIFYVGLLNTRYH